MHDGSTPCSNLDLERNAKLFSWRLDRRTPTVLFPIPTVFINPDFFQGGSQHRGIGGSVDIRGVDAGMAQEVFDVGQGNAGLIQVHRPRVSEQMGV